MFWKNSGTDNEVGRAAELISNRESTLQESLPDLLLRFGKPLNQGGFPTDAYVAFSTRDYWKCIWIIQEVYQARHLDFVCGDASLPSNLLAGAITLIEMFLKHIISDQASVPSTQTAQGQLLHKFALAIPPLPPMNSFSPFLPRSKSCANMQKKSVPEMAFVLEEYQPLIAATVYLAPTKFYWTANWYVLTHQRSHGMKRLLMDYVGILRGKLRSSRLRSGRTLNPFSVGVTGVRLLLLLGLSGWNPLIHEKQAQLPS